MTLKQPTRTQVIGMADKTIGDIISTTTKFPQATQRRGSRDGKVFNLVAATTKVNSTLSGSVKLHHLPTTSWSVKLTFVLTGFMLICQCFIYTCYSAPITTEEDMVVVVEPNQVVNVPVSDESRITSTKTLHELAGQSPEDQKYQLSDKVSIGLDVKKPMLSFVPNRDFQQFPLNSLKQKQNHLHKLNKRSGISDQRLAEIQMIRALKKQLVERASKLQASSSSSSSSSTSNDSNGGEEVPAAPSDNSDSS